MTYQYILFDLDGTLTDSSEGITKSVAYALQSCGIKVADLHELDKFIGPPLIDSFQQFYGMNQEQAQKAVSKYRERFSQTGIFENRVYPGIPELLTNLKQQGKHL
ncbi:HAD hydrolase-like protein, partial [Liquorilactobacillus nagelii]